MDQTTVIHRLPPPHRRQSPILVGDEALSAECQVPGELSFSPDYPTTSVVSFEEQECADISPVEVPFSVVLKDKITDSTATDSKGG